MRQIFGITYNMIQDRASTMTMKAGTKIEDFEYESVIEDDMEQLREVLLRDLRRNARRKPFIIVMDVLDEELQHEFATIATAAKATYKHINSDAEATKARIQFRQENKGLFLVDLCYIRGLDLKLQVDAEVLIIEQLGKFRHCDVIQAMGRGCRSQAQGKGKLYMIADACNTPDAYELIKGRDTATQTNDGGKNVRELFEVSQVLTDSHIPKLREAFTGDNWKCYPSDFKKNFSQASMALEALQ